MWTEPDEHDVEECWKMIEQEYQDWIEEGDYSQEPWWKRAEDILDEVTRYNEDMGLNDEKGDK